MNAGFDLIVFDWDGTLMDSTRAIARAIQLACRDLGLPVPDDTRARHVIGLGFTEALQYAAPALPPRDYPKIAARYRRHYLATHEELALFPGIADLLAWLAGEGRLLAVATGKSRAGLAHALEHSGLGPFFQATRCADECFSKPHPAMLEELMAELKVAPARTLMIGDTTHDLQMAKNAGVAGVGVGFGAHALAALRAEAPLACVETPRELADWLKANVVARDRI
ncbi:MAG: HAD-IIIA family hydrolase [Azoarcus sp.]|jgi:phosphoglycolate phosphatase|nr:HAD-IIIA family hydrolase [Azoarcus sp.]